MSQFAEEHEPVWFHCCFQVSVDVKYHHHLMALYILLDELECCMAMVGLAISSEASCHLAHELDA